MVLNFFNIILSYIIIKDNHYHKLQNKKRKVEKYMITIRDIVKANLCSQAYWLSKQTDSAVSNKVDSFSNYFITEAKSAVFSGLKWIEIPQGTPEMMAQATKESLKNYKAISNAVFIYGDIIIRCNIVWQNKRKRKVNIYDFQATTVGSTKIKNSDLIRFTVLSWVISQIGFLINSFKIINVDSSYVNTGSYVPEKVFKKTDITAQVMGNLGAAPGYVDSARKAILACSSSSKSKPSVTKKCAGCEFRNSCLPDEEIFHLPLTMEKKIFLFNHGIKTYEDVVKADDSVYKFSESSKKIAEWHLRDSHVIEKGKIKDFISEFKFPLYFLDFESFQMGMPEWKGTSAYMQIPFQYSLHKLSNKGKLSHYEFLGESGQDPRRNLALSLISDVKSKGTILAYNAAFEKSRIRDLANCFPDLSEQLLKIASRIQDLMIPFRARWYYMKEFDAKYSIKIVLPALFPDDPSLNYHNLDLIHNGEEAMSEFSNIKNMIPEDQEATKKSLLEYCCLDTYALVKIYFLFRDM